MTRDDRLDTLLGALNQPTLAPSRHIEDETTLTGIAVPQPGDRELAPLLDAARDLARFAQARPDPAFAARLGERMLARASVLREDAARAQRVERPDDDFAAGITAGIAALPGLLGSAERSVPERGGAELSAMPQSAPAARGTSDHLGGGHAGGVRTLPLRPAPRRAILRPALIAAALVMLLGGSAFVAMQAASAAPGTPLFALRQLEQQAGQSFMDASGRAKAHLQSARQWLGDLRAAAGGQPGSGSYRATLDTLLSENAAAAQSIQQVAPGATRDSLTAQLAALHTDEQTTLLAVLPQLGWPDRITTTQALGTLGAAVPAITGATITTSHGLWQVTLTGSGFEPGAVLLIDGRPAGSVSSVTSTTLIAEAPSGLFKNGTVTLGIGNPDGTATTTTAVVQVAAPTATPNSHGNGNGNGNGNGGNPHGSPTGTPTGTTGTPGNPSGGSDTTGH